MIQDMHKNAMVYYTVGHHRRRSRISSMEGHKIILEDGHSLSWYDPGVVVCVPDHLVSATIKDLIADQHPELQERLVAHSGPIGVTVADKFTGDCLGSIRIRQERADIYEYEDGGWSEDPPDVCEDTYEFRIGEFKVNLDPHEVDKA